jgi:hypothetical protein
MTYMLIKKILAEQFKSLSSIKIEYENLKIEVKEKLATAEFDMRVIATIGNQTGYIIGDLKTPAHIKLFLEKERARWLVIKTEGIQASL